jgi:hypothetical protein
LELYKFANSIDFDIPLLSTEELFGKIDGFCNTKGISKQFDDYLITIINDRVDQYKNLQSIFNLEIIDNWIQKANNLKSQING